MDAPCPSRRYTLYLCLWFRFLPFYAVVGHACTSKEAASQGGIQVHTEAPWLPITSKWATYNMRELWMGCHHLHPHPHIKSISWRLQFRMWDRPCSIVVVELTVAHSIWLPIRMHGNQAWPPKLLRFIKHLVSSWELARNNGSCFSYVSFLFWGGEGRGAGWNASMWHRDMLVLSLMFAYRCKVPHPLLLSPFLII